MNAPACLHPAWIEIDVRQLKKNIALVKSHIGKSLYCLPVKANAYGHGLCPIGKITEEAGIDYLAVAHLQEAVRLRQAQVRIPILVLGAIHEDQIPDLIDWNLEFTISSRFKAECVAKECKKLNKKCRIHLEVDTGMQRTGMRAATARELFNYLKTVESFDIVGVYSHLATAEHSLDAFAQKQVEEFYTLMQQPPFHQQSLIRHLANSGGTLFFPQAHLDMVRPSLVTFGYLPKEHPPSWAEIAPCFSLKAKISYFKVVSSGSGISYGHSHITPKQTRIVTIPVGYGDGYRRCLSNRGSVLIRGRRFPIVGTICMDQFMVDIGDQEVYVGEEAVLIGKQNDVSISLMEMAELCGTIPYEILCLFNERIPRVYINAG
ncbi:MAG TPA: alanine racemase [Rhabdochlamydiaceae bacterium]|jgi:alanine racemase